MMPEPQLESGGSERPGLSVFDRVLIAIIAVTLAAVCLLISAAHGTKTGYQSWGLDSVLRSVTELLNFNYRYPTSGGADIKWLAHGLGVVAAVLAAAVMWFARSRSGGADLSEAAPEAVPKPTRRDIPPILAAQAILVLYALWAVLSAAWSPWGEASFGEGLRQVIWAMWALVLGRGLSRRGVRGAAVALASVLVVTAGLGLWYRYVRSPFMRLEFPIGNPLFMAACLLAGLLIAGLVLFGIIAEMMDRSRSRKVAPAETAGEVTRDMGGWWLAIGALVAVVVMAWAFWLTESRWAQWALVAGAAAAVWLVSARIVRWLLPIAAVVAVIAFLAVYWPALTTAGMTGRDATIRFRIYAAQYAADLFQDAPLVGNGQGSYRLLGQAMQSPDREKDPAAFIAPVLGDAHNEYLQIASELGIVGIILWIAFLVMTFWAAVRAWSKASSVMDQWLMAGLLAAFTAIAVEEAADVALRKPGLPAVFYTVVGLIWAFSLRLSSTPEPVIRPRSNPVRGVGLVVGIAAALGIGSLVWRDWEGALASYQVLEQATNGEWAASINAVQTATSRRLSVEDYVEAYSNTTQAAMLASSSQLQDCGHLSVLLQQDERARAQIIEDIRQKTAEFDAYAQICGGAGRYLLIRIPGYPGVAMILAELELMRQQCEAIEQQAGLRDKVTDYTGPARILYELELDRDPQNLAVALRVIGLSANERAAYRLGILRKPLRKGPVRLRPDAEQFAVDPLAEIEPVLMSLMGEEDFDEAVQEMLRRAQRELTVQDAKNWKDPYAPESLRLVARVNKLGGHFPEAAELAGQAAQISKALGGTFPGAVANALLDQSRYRLLGQQFAEAVAACDEAAKQWPNVRERELQLRPVLQTRAMYMLAAGSETEARTLMAKLYPQAQTAELDRRLSAGYAALCEAYMNFPPDMRPSAYSRWLDRSLALHADNRTAHLLAARLAFQQNNTAGTAEHLKTAVRISFAQGDDASGFQYLRTLGELTRDPALLGEFVRQLSQQYPANTALQRLVEAGPEVLIPPTTSTAPETATAPATTSTAPQAPATRPTMATTPG